MKIDLRLGDCIEVLKTIPDNSIDSIVTDPPYGLGFMGKEWDTFDKSEFGNIPDECSDENVYNKKGFNTLPRYKTDGLYQFAYDWATECLRVLKPGGHLLSFAGSRTYHKICMGIEDAGFEIRDQIMWVYGSGFPKSHNIGKAIDKIEGNEREIIGTSKGKGYSSIQEKNLEHGNRPYVDGLPYEKADRTLTKGNSEWEGWGTALKPAHEPIVMARKPLSEKSIAENVLKHGTGGINIDGSRIVIKEGDGTSAGHRTCNIFETEKISGGNGSPDYETHELGRFPANIIFDEEAGKLLDEQSGERGNGWKKNYGREDYDGLQYSSSTQQCKFGGGYNGKNTYVDKGGASRFFYCPKTSKKDRNEGLDVDKQKNPRPIGVAFNNESDLFQQTTGNNHPTVKPTDLMRYLINLVTPKGGTTLDPFMGSGSTGKAAVQCGVNFIGIEKEEEYMKIAEARISHERNKTTQGKLFQ